MLRKARLDLQLHGPEPAPQQQQHGNAHGLRHFAHLGPYGASYYGACAAWATVELSPSIPAAYAVCQLFADRIWNRLFDANCFDAAKGDLFASKLLRWCVSCACGSSC